MSNKNYCIYEIILKQPVSDLIGFLHVVSRVITEKLEFV